MGVQASDGFLEAGNSLSEMWLCAWSTTGVLKDIDHGSAGFSGFWQYEGCGAWTASVTNHGHDDEFVPTQRGPQAHAVGDAAGPCMNDLLVQHHRGFAWVIVGAKEVEGNGADEGIWGKEVLRTRIQLLFGKGSGGSAGRSHHFGRSAGGSLLRRGRA